MRDKTLLFTEPAHKHRSVLLDPENSLPARKVAPLGKQKRRRPRDACPASSKVIRPSRTTLLTLKNPDGTDVTLPVYKDADVFSSEFDGIIAMNCEETQATRQIDSDCDSDELTCQTGQDLCERDLALASR